jgi:AcrR family transcriptional regulator
MKYADYLQREFASQFFASKGERTRARLKIAAATALEEIGFQACTVAEISRRAGVALGTFYVYFADKSEIAGEILVDFGDALHGDAQKLARGTSNFEAILVTNRIFVKAYQLNPGLLRCHFQLEDHDPAFRAKRRRLRHQWVSRIARSIARRTSAPAGAKNLCLPVSYALESMVFQFLYDVFVKQNPDLSRQAADPDRVAELLSILWYRAVYCENPPDTIVKHAKAALQIGAPTHRTNQPRRKHKR